MITFIVAFVAAALIMPAVIWGARRWRLLDVPNHRSSHSSVIPRGGGVGVVVGALAGIATAREWSSGATAVVSGALVLALVGLIDDRVGLSALPRLLAQTVVPFVGALVVTDHAGWAMLAVAAIAACCVAAFVNAFNFMDGINGISGSQAGLAGFALSIAAADHDASDIVVLGLAIAGASLGFLPFNLPRAFIFLGDVGSYFIGFWLAGTALLVLDLGVSPLVVVGPFVIYLLDTGTVLVRRARRGASLTEAHREHVYQRLTQAGLSHLAVTTICAGATLACCAMMLSVIDARSAAQLAAFAGCVIVGVTYLSLPSLIARRSFRPPRVAT